MPLITIPTPSMESRCRSRYASGGNRSSSWQDWIRAYRHEVTVQTLGIEFSAVVFFAQDSAFNRNFLGRSGWLDRLRIAIVDYDRLLFVSPYQS
jgi:hypothetical protein